MASSTIMMQSMCNNQFNDLGAYGSQYNTQVNFNPNLDATYTNSPAAITPDFAGGAIYATSPGLTMPPMNFSGGVSPQMIPMGYPAVSPPIMPVMDVNVPSMSPPSVSAPLGLLPAMPMMGYSMMPFPQPPLFVGLAQPGASSSVSSDTMYLIPEMAYTHPCSISRSCSPAPSEETSLSMDYSSEKIEVSRERLPSSASIGSIDSNGQISKKELVEDCLNKIDQIFGDRVQTTGMRGATVMRIKVKTRPALELIIDLLRLLEQNCNITAISCPKSTKKGKQHIRGFLAYIQTNTVAEIDQVQRVFDEFNRAHTIGEASPFKTLEVNPQKKTQN